MDESLSKGASVDGKMYSMGLGWQNEREAREDAKAHLFVKIIKHGRLLRRNGYGIDAAFDSAASIQTTE